MNTNQADKMKAYCDQHHPRIHVTVDFISGQVTIPTEHVAIIMYDIGDQIDQSTPGNVRFQPSLQQYVAAFTTGDVFQNMYRFVRKMNIYYPITWINYYYNQGHAKRPRPPFHRPEGFNIDNLPSSSKSTIKVSSKSIESIDNVIDSCLVQFSDITDPEYKKIANRMKRICNDLTRKCAVQRVTDIRNKLVNFNSYEHKTFPRFRLDPEKPFTYLLNNLFRTKQHNNIVGLFKKQYTYNEAQMYIHYINQQGIGIGNVNNFVTSAIAEIERAKFFVPIEKDSTRYVVNPKMNVQLAKHNGFTHVKTEADVALIYYSIGELFALLTRFDVPVPFHFAHEILASLIYSDKEISPEMHLMYHFMDEDPERVYYVIQLMRKPNDIEYVYMNMNDDYKLKPNVEEELIDRNNFMEYWKLYARHKYLRQLTPDSPDIYEYTKAFVSGFYIKRMLNKNNVSVRELDYMMSGTSITIRAVQEWANTPSVLRVLRSGNDNQKEEQIFEWLVEIIKEVGATFPIDYPGAAKFIREVEQDENDAGKSSSGSAGTKRKQKVFMKFFMDLIHFWTGFRKIDKTHVYQVIFERANGMPTSHTCFKQLALPRNIESKEALYIKLIDAIVMVERGVGRI
jgi:hypothetical protein